MSEEGEVFTIRDAEEGEFVKGTLIFCLKVSFNTFATSCLCCSRSVAWDHEFRLGVGRVRNESNKVIIVSSSISYLCILARITCSC